MNTIHDTRTTEDYGFQRARTCSHPWPGILSITATYVFFLLFAQFGFLKQLTSHLSGERDLRMVMACMGLSGVAASVLTSRWLRGHEYRNLLRIGFMGCAVTAIASHHCSLFWHYATTAFAIGGFLGVLTVALAASLRCLLCPQRFGFQIGLGTGLAYLVCNIPAVFDSSPENNAVIAAVFALAGFLLNLVTAAGDHQAQWDSDLVDNRLEADYHGFGFSTIVVAFLALIWFDSAAFYTIQQSVDLKALTWNAPAQKWANGIVHLLVAVITGTLIDRGWFRGLLAAAFGLLAAGFLLLEGSAGNVTAMAAPLYVAGVSVYSVALVAFPTRIADVAGAVPTRWRAGVLYGVSGWIGSAMGIGMAQDLHCVPPLFLWLTGALVIGSWLAQCHRQRLASLAASGELTLALGLSAFPFLVVRESRLSAIRHNLSAIERGRQVYISEGCIHCHSQYVRPRADDVERWGPFHPVDRKESPPLIGNRRQGPDLMNVGNRRSANWQKLHLLDPPALSPGSVMPAYAHLFRAGDTQGDDLVAYLNSLGQDTTVERQSIRSRWMPDPRAVPIDQRAAAGLYLQSCAQCHGATGRGDGPVSGKLHPPPRDLARGEFIFISASIDDAEHFRELCRVVKFGVSGTSMPGHEYFTDAEILGLARYVWSLRSHADANAPVPASGIVEHAIFQKHCAQCHGATGLGDGPVSQFLQLPPRDLAHDPFKYIPDHLAADERRHKLAEIIRSGIPSASMPAFGSLSDEDVAELVDIVEELRGSGKLGVSP